MKLRRKLLAAGFAFGATALTLTTSTFAWYTTNQEATVEKISGMTSATADNSSFYVAAAKTYSGADATEFTAYGSKAKPTLTATADTHVLTPVSYKGKVGDATTYTNYVPFAGTKYVAPSPETDNKNDNTVTYAAYDATKVYEYVLRFRVANKKTEATKLYFKEFNLTTKKNATYKDQMSLAHGTVDGFDTGVTETGAYFADLAKSMKLTITSQNLEESDNEEAAGYVDGCVPTSDAAVETVYDLSAFATQTDDNIGTANALGYYNAVLSKNLSTPAAEQATVAGLTTKGASDADKALAFTEIPASGYVEVRFTFWLDGWDSYCYDIMQQQEFTFDFVATAADASATIYSTK